MSASLSTSQFATLSGAALAERAARDPLATQNASLQVPATPAYVLGDALAVHQQIGTIDDWCITGSPADAERLFRALVAGAGIDSASLPWAAVESLCEQMTFTEVETWDFRWTDQAPRVRDGGPEVSWLVPDDDAEVQALLDEAFPTAVLQIGHPVVRRWAGIRDPNGALVACAADATTAAGLGFLSSITAAPAVRGTGVGAAVTAWATAALVAEHGRAGLWVNHPNLAARRVYDLLGFHDDHQMAWVDLGPAARDGPHHPS
ncbi:MAG TPA: GNAT family N-acetyltransferase [Mycobacteriales bacterium]|nr:GNAT family N-acetyltransferase [Mycobacteriales bacterium]